MVVEVIGLLGALVVGCDEEVGPEREQLSRYVASEFRADASGGVVLVARRADVLLREAYGFADVERRVPMRVDQALPIGSITKSFTAGVILRLVEEGTLSLDDDVRDLGFGSSVGGRRVTVEQLLTHTSGMPNLVDVDGFMDWAREPRTVGELLGLTDGSPFLFEPGHGFAYSDSGYILLGGLIERVTGMTYGEAVVEHVARPLGLAGTRSAVGLEEPATGYTTGPDGSAVPATPIHMSVPHASGGLVATVDDLRRWVRGFAGGEVVDATMVARALHRRALPDGTPSGYGYGWKRCTLAGADSIHHGGWVPGFTAGLVHLPEHDLTAVALVNHDDGAPEAMYVARRALRLLLTGDPHVVTVDVDEAARDRLCGIYRSASGTTLRVEPNEASWDLRWNDGAPIRLVALGPTVLAAARSDGTWCFEFETDETGVVTAVRSVLSCEPGVTARRVAGD